MGDSASADVPPRWLSLAPSERVVRSALANRHADGSHDGGRLVLTSERLAYMPGRLSKVLDRTDAWNLRLADIDQWSVIPVKLTSPFRGGIRRRLSVTSTAGSVTVFVVNEERQWAAALDETVEP